MGNTRSELFQQVSVDPWWSNDKQIQCGASRTKQKETMSDHPTEELSAIHERRIKLISEKRKEMNDLRQENEELKRLLAEHNIHLPLTTKVDAHQQTEVFEVPGEPNTSDLQGQIEDLQAEIDDKNQIKQENLELQKNIAELQDDLQKANSAIAAFEDERQKYKTHVAALKDIIAVSKQLLLMREGQIKEVSCSPICITAFLLYYYFF